MKIGELAQRAGCDVQTVRFYEREGLLPAPDRESSGYRHYNEDHAAQLRFIRHCRSLNIPLPEVRQLLGFAARPTESCGEVDRLLDRHIALVRERLGALRMLEKQLVSLRQTCDGEPSQPCAILRAFMDATERAACACHPGK